MRPTLHLAPAFPTARTDLPALAAEPISVVLADDHAPMRRSLRLLLEREHDLVVVAEAADHNAVARQVQELHPQVLVLDMWMDGSSSIATLQTLSERVPETRILAISMEDDPAFAGRAITAGALGFIAKDQADVELAQAIRAAAEDREFISPRIAARLNALYRVLCEDKLTQREVEVLRLIAFGHTSVEIARRLALSPRTIETHRAHIHKKLGLPTRAELVRYALRRGLIGT